jgi:isoleucyl-tRNA synthetase
VLRLRLGAGRSRGRVQDKVDVAVDVAFPLRDDQRDLASAFGLSALPAKPVAAVIWTTTPWTLPANQALNLHPELSYDLVDVGSRLLILASERTAACLASYELAGTVLAATRGAALSLLRFGIRFMSATRRSISATT